MDQAPTLERHDDGQLDALRALMGAGRYSEAVALAQSTAGSIAPPERLPLLALWDDARFALRGPQGPGSMVPGSAWDADSEAVSQLPGPAAAARIAARRARYLAWQLDEVAPAACADALSLARTAGDPEATAMALLASHVAEADPARVAARREIGRALLDAATASGSPELIAFARWRCLADAIILGDSAGIDYHHLGFVAAARGLQDPHWEGLRAVEAGLKALIEGRYPDAVSEARSLNGRGEGFEFAREAAAVQLMVAVVDTGSGAEAAAEAASIVAARRAEAPQWRLGLASFLMGASRFAEARAEFREVNLETLPRDSTYVVALCLAADLADHLNEDVATRERILDLLRPFCGQVALLGDGMAFFGPVDIFYGCLARSLGRTSDAMDAARRAHDLCASIRARRWLATALIDLSRLVPTEADAIAFRSQALGIGRELGLRPVVMKAADMLGIPPDTIGPAPPPAEEGRPSFYAEHARSAAADLESARSLDARLEALKRWEAAAFALRPGPGQDLHREVRGLRDALRQTETIARGDAPATALLLALRARFRAWHRPQEPDPIYDEAVRALGPAPDPWTAVIAFGALHKSIDDPARLVERLPVAEKLLQAASRLGEPWALAFAHWRAAIDALTTADSPGYDYHLNHLERAAAATGEPLWQALAHNMAGGAAFLEGDWERCLAHSQEALAIASREEMAGRADESAAQQFLVAAMLERPPQAELPTKVVATNRGAHAHQRTGWAFFLRAIGRHAEAREELVRTPYRELQRDASWLVALGEGAEMNLAYAIPEPPFSWFEEQLDSVGGLVCAVADGIAAFCPIDYYRALLAAARGDPTAATALLRTAYSQASALRARPSMARIQLALARSLAPVDPAGALEAASRSAEIAAAVGLRGLTREARDLVRELNGDRPAASSPSPPATTLTAREREVLALLGEGWHASDIARMLVLSTRTVEKHIEHIYQKTGARSRQEASALARTLLHRP